MTRSIYNIILGVLILSAALAGGVFLVSYFNLSNISLTTVMIVVVGVGSVLIDKYFNRHINKLIKQARICVRKRLSQRVKVPVDEVICDIGVEKSRAKYLVEIIAGIINVAPELLRQDDKLSDLIRVQPDELDAGMRQLWEKEKLGESLDVYSEVILFELGERYGKVVWKKRWSQLAEDVRPVNEKMWAKFIESMTLKEIILFFEEGILPEKQAGMEG